LVGAGGENVVSRGCHASKNFSCLSGRFSSCVDDLGEPGSQGTVVVDAGVAKVFEGKRGEALRGGGGRKVATFDGGKEFEEGDFVHCFAVLLEW
jgi:hypothetical protein